MPAETLPAPTTDPETPTPFDPEQGTFAWLRATADTDGMLPWAWTPSAGRAIGVNNTATTVTAPDAGQWWWHYGDTWQPTSWPQIREHLTTWGQAHAGFTEHPGRADATWRAALQWLRDHASHRYGAAGTETFGRPPTTWATRGADGSLPDNARGRAELFLAENYYPPKPLGGRRLAWWHGGFHAWTPDGWERVNNADTITEQIRGWLNGATHVDIPAIDIEVRGICNHEVGVGHQPTPLELCDEDQHRAAQLAAKTIVPQPIGAPA